MTPSQVGSYQILGPLGEGGMGQVFRAVHATLGTPAAVKLASPETLQKPELRARFLNEARALHAIQHPGVVRVLDCGEVTPLPAARSEPAGEAPLYLVMELLSGQTLGAHLHGGPLPLAEVCHLGRQLADALLAVHRAGLVHRDLKPDNVMLLEQPGGAPPRAVIIDFGVAKVPADLAEAAPTALTRLQTEDGVTLGTLQYMAPEQCLDPSAATAASDSYALGVLLYEALAGRRPFLGSAQVVLAQQLEATPPGLRRQRPEIPRALERLVLGLLARDPAARPSLTRVRLVLGRDPRAARHRQVAWGLAGLLFAALLGATPQRERGVLALQRPILTRVTLRHSYDEPAGWLLPLAHGLAATLGAGLPLPRARALHKQADADQRDGQLGAAEVGYEAALTSYEAALRRPSIESAKIRGWMAASANERGQVQQHRGQLEAAAASYRQSLALHLQDGGSERSLVDYRIAGLAAERGDPEAARLFEAADRESAPPAQGGMTPKAAWQRSRLLLARALVQVRRGDRGCHGLLDEAQQLSKVGEQNPSYRPHWQAEFLLDRAEVFAALGDAPAARQALYAGHYVWLHIHPQGARARHDWLRLCTRGLQVDPGPQYQDCVRQRLQELRRQGSFTGDRHLAEAEVTLARSATETPPERVPDHAP